MRKIVRLLFFCIVSIFPAAFPVPLAAETAVLPISHPIDINSASKAELMTLPGVGEARSDAILKNRPYRGKDELVSKRIVPDPLFQIIKDKIIAR